MWHNWRRSLILTQRRRWHYASLDPLEMVVILWFLSDCVIRLYDLFTRSGLRRRRRRRSWPLGLARHDSRRRRPLRRRRRHGAVGHCRQSGSGRRRQWHRNCGRRMDVKVVRLGSGTLWRSAGQAHSQERQLIEKGRCRKRPQKKGCRK